MRSTSEVRSARRLPVAADAGACNVTLQIHDTVRARTLRVLLNVTRGVRVKHGMPESWATGAEGLMYSSSVPAVHSAGNKIGAIENLGATEVRSLGAAPSVCSPATTSCLCHSASQQPYELRFSGPLQNQFDSIDLSDNAIVKLEGFPKLHRLKWLLLNNNRIVRIAPHLEGEHRHSGGSVKCILHRRLHSVIAFRSAYNDYATSSAAPLQHLQLIKACTIWSRAEHIPNLEGLVLTNNRLAKLQVHFA